MMELTAFLSLRALLLVVAAALLLAIPPAIHTAKFHTSTSSSSTSTSTSRRGRHHHDENPTTNANANNTNNANNANMNGDYTLASTPGSNNTQHLFPTNYRDYPDADIVPTEFFDVYSPLISQLYSQVFWKGLPPVRLPQHIIDKYHNVGMAVIGFEMDQVMTDAVTGVEFSVPMNAVYNHHFETTMIGGDKAHFEVTSPDDPRVLAHTSTMAHGIPPHQPYWLVVGGDDNSNGDDDGDGDATATDSYDLPTQHDFGGGNGGEARQTFHGLPPGFAELIQSPREIQITPMQIDTWHREQMPLRADDIMSAPFVAGPLPRNSKAPPNSTYSGLLECPLTTRITKHLPPQGVFPLADGGECSTKITTSHDCFQAVLAMVRESDASSEIHQVSGYKDPSRPVGCSMRATTLPSAAAAAAAAVDDGDDGTPQERVVEAYFNGDNPDESQVQASAPTPTCGGPSTADSLFSATATSLVNVSIVIDAAEDLVTMHLTGPADVWFGVGFGAHAMSDHPWTIVVSGSEGSDDDDDGNNATVTEYRLGHHFAGAILKSSIHVQSVHVDLHGDRLWRNVTLTRSIRGEIFSFRTNGITEIPFINAVGSTKEFSYHKTKEASSLLLLPVAIPKSNSNASICVCQQVPPPFGHTKGGVLEYHPVEGQAGERGMAGKVVVPNQCAPYPRTDLLDQQNPTCDIRTYSGGQNSCHHMWSLLDADQDIPWLDQPLEYQLKFRFWVQPYNATYHAAVKRHVWGLASPTEYDVPKCAEGILGCSKQQLVDETTGRQKEERWVHTIRSVFPAQIKGSLVRAHFHCHAPGCLKTALYLCDQTNHTDGDGTSGGGGGGCDKTTGTLLCEENTVRTTHGGEGGERFHEKDFIHQPPCLWGDSSVGLEAPINVTGRTLYAFKTADATNGHGGEMAWLQMYYI